MMVVSRLQDISTSLLRNNNWHVRIFACCDLFEVGDGTLSHHCFCADRLTATDPRCVHRTRTPIYCNGKNFVPAIIIPGFFCGDAWVFKGSLI